MRCSGQRGRVLKLDLLSRRYRREGLPSSDQRPPWRCRYSPKQQGSVRRLTVPSAFLHALKAAITLRGGPSRDRLRVPSTSFQRCFSSIVMTASPARLREGTAHSLFKTSFLISTGESNQVNDLRLAGELLLEVPGLAQAGLVNRDGFSTPHATRLILGLSFHFLV